MTEKLYDHDSYLKEFSAIVLSCEPYGDKFCTILDKTAFFPEEAGQCCDTGTINGIGVIQVDIDENGIIRHITDGYLTGEVTGKIDFDKRFRNMQNHTGEHILSGLFYKHFGFHNVGFHLGSEEITMDVSGALDRQQLDIIEKEANDIVFRNVAVRAYYPEKSELENMFYRSKGDIDGEIRIVQIGEYDSCACCAPHVNYTGEVGLIKILEFYKNRNATRIHIKCGFEALADYNEKYRNVTSISHDLKSPCDQTAQAVKELLNQNKELSFTIGKLKRELVLLKSKSIPFTKGNLCIFEEAQESDTLRILANCLKDKCDGICAVLSGNDKDGYSTVLASNSIDLKKNAPIIFGALNGVGGGQKSMLFGSFKATADAIKDFFKDLTLQ